MSLLPGNGSSPPGIPVAGGDDSGGGELRWASLLIVAVIIPTIGGNILVILAVALERKLQNATNYFLMSLAVADLLVGLLVMPIALVTVLFNSGWPLPGYLCPIWLFLDVLFSTASIMHLCAISLDRYIAIKRPIQHSQYKSRSKALAKITVVWLISIGIATPIPIKGLQNFHFPNNVTFVNDSCVLKPESFRQFIKYGSLAAFFIPLTIMMVIYLLTIRVLQRKACLLRTRATRRRSLATVSQPGGDPSPDALVEGSRNHHHHPHPQHPGGTPGEDLPIRRMSTMGKKSMQNLSNEQRASKVLGIVFLLFVVMWCPFFITNVTSALCGAGCDGRVVAQLMEVFVWVGYVSSGINPLVYTLFNRTFRDAFARYITCNYGAVATAPAGEPQRKNTAVLLRPAGAPESAALLIVTRGVSNGLGAGAGSPLRRRPNPPADPPAPPTASILLDTLLLAEKQNCRYEECVSYV
ncbi:5-hydroxytryptamine receptor 2B [Conger conger]|uniref:5-hydroxytryptamine receptor 2B n=1 Tax=Conger conger TaxID=82655 RepID=UPI002A59F2C6|nr:5-hydroxytryptamine receptor 2B [Conger conger]